MVWAAEKQEKNKGTPIEGTALNSEFRLPREGSVEAVIFEVVFPMAWSLTLGGQQLCRFYATNLYMVL